MGLIDIIEMIGQDIINECWRSISGFVNYQISNIGRVRNAQSGRILKPAAGRAGYYTVSLRKDKRQITRYIHHLVAGEFIDRPPGKVYVDHIDGDKLHNQTTNLRWATPSQNRMNAKKRAGSSSRYKGVCYNNPSKQWVAHICIGGKLIYLGIYEDETVAARVYNKKAIDLFGAFAKLNTFE